GFTKRHPDVPEELRGFAGLSSPAALEYLHDLGVTAVELLPIHYHIDEHFLIEKGRINYWGYNTLGYFAPDPRYAANGPQRAAQEFKSMVRTLHAEGFEVTLDVVYNHTAEADHRGPTLSMRGIDNVAYYRLAEDRSRYVDFTGCGNSLNVDNPHVLQLIMDSLRYWLLEMHVDGFRFDLASALAHHWRLVLDSFQRRPSRNRFSSWWARTRVELGTCARHLKPRLTRTSSRAFGRLPVARPHARGVASRASSKRTNEIKPMNITSLGEARFPSPVRHAVSDQARIPAEIVRDPAVPARDEVLFELAGPRDKLFFDPTRTRAGIVTCGGLCPGLNNVIRALFFELHHTYGVAEVLGFRGGYQGLDPALGTEPTVL